MLRDRNNRIPQVVSWNPGTTVLHCSQVLIRHCTAAATRELVQPLRCLCSQKQLARLLYRQARRNATFAYINCGQNHRFWASKLTLKLHLT